MTSSPTFKNLGLKPKQSPVEIKEKMRKNYKNKVQKCRGMLLDKLRGSTTETDLHTTLTNIYKSMFNFTDENFNAEEMELMDEIKNDLVLEELEWLNKEYDYYQMMNVDWQTIEENNDVICPVCKKTNFELNQGNLKCSFCNITMSTTKMLSDIKKDVFSLLDNHNSACNHDAQFGYVTEGNETHIYLICESCMEMKLVV